MVRSRFTRRRVGILLALLLPALILLHGLGSADAQFPKPPGIPNPPFGPKMPGGPFGPKMPGGTFGPKKLVYDWRCSKCGQIIATTTSPFSPGLGSCPNCGVKFINGGKHFINPPANMPPANMPPGNMPPPNMPPGNMPPANMPPPNMPQGGMPPVQPNMPPPVQPVDAPNDPVVAPPMDPAPLAPAGAQAGTCRWCNGEVSPGNQYCWRCKLVFGVVTIGGTFMVLVVAGICAVLVFLFMRSGAR